MTQPDDPRTVATLNDVDYRIQQAGEAIWDQGAYVAAAEWLEEAAKVLRALNEREVRERIEQA